MRENWIKLHRKILDNPVVTKDADHLAIWIWLLCEANFTDTERQFGGKKIVLKAGQLITGREQIAKELRVNESKIQRVLKKFEIEHQIEQQTTRYGRLISIVNWDMYQDCEQQPEQQVNNKCTTSEQQVNATKERKNIRNIYNTSKITEEFDRLWEMYPRKSGKQNAMKSYIKARKDGTKYEDVEKGIAAYTAYITAMGTEQRYVKMGSTFFNQRSWEDDWTVRKEPKGKTGVYQQEPPKYKQLKPDEHKETSQMPDEMRNRLGIRRNA